MMKAFELIHNEKTQHALPSETLGTERPVTRVAVGEGSKANLAQLLRPQVLLLDGRGHLLGRLSAIVAKQLLLGMCY